MGHVIIANPASGGGKGLEALPRVEARLAELGIAFETRLTSGPGDATGLAQEGARSGADTIVVLGGDGTLFEALNGVMPLGSRPRIAQIPVGTGNSFIKDLGIESLEDGLAALDARRPRRVDVGRATTSTGDFWFINLTGAGFVARVARRARGLKSLGNLAYVLAVFLELPGLKSQRLDIVADGVASSRQALFLEICNSRKTGGDMIMAPGAEVDDGLFEVVIARAMGRMKLLSLFPLIFKGTHVDDPIVEIIACKSITARFERPEPVTPDGELRGETDLSAEILPGAIEVLSL